jgi:hypothetical protein
MCAFWWEAARKCCSTFKVDGSIRGPILGFHDTTGLGSINNDEVENNTALTACWCSLAFLSRPAVGLSPLHFSISAAVGFVSLLGVSVMNGILIMTYYNDVRANSVNAVEAMFHAASQRMRPMLMTALSACIGLLPAAVSTGIGNEVQQPLATVVVGGMFLGPIILLVMVPALHSLVLERTSWGAAADRPAEPISGV